MSRDYPRTLTAMVPRRRSVSETTEDGEMTTSRHLHLTLLELGINDTDRQRGLRQMRGSVLLDFTSRLLSDLDRHLETGQVTASATETITAKSVLEKWETLPLVDFEKWLAEEAERE